MAQLSIFELITRKTAVQLNISESVVEKIIQHKSKAVYEAQYLHNTVEDSGLGTWKVRIKVAIKRIAKIDRDIKWITEQLQGGLTDKEIGKYKKILSQIEEEKLYLESKI